MYSSTTDPATHMTTHERSEEVKETFLFRLLTSRMFVRYIECLTVVFFPWVLLTEQEAKTMEELEGWDEDDFKF